MATVSMVSREQIRAGAGSHFDPRVVDAFETIPDATLTGIGSAIQ